MIKILLLLIALFGCATAPMAPIDKDTKAKLFETSQDAASLYIYRNENFGGAISMDISVNGRTVGQTAPKSYFKFDLIPGNYHIESKAENVSFLDITLMPGKNYFVWQEVKMGIFYARSKLLFVSDDEGKKGVLESRLINTSVSAQNLAPEGAALTKGNQTSSKLSELKSLLEKDEISQSEYDQAKAKLLKEF